MQLGYVSLFIGEFLVYEMKNSKGNWNQSSLMKIERLFYVFFPVLKVFLNFIYVRRRGFLLYKLLVFWDFSYFRKFLCSFMLTLYKPARCLSWHAEKYPTDPFPILEPKIRDPRFWATWNLSKYGFWGSKLGEGSVKLFSSEWAKFFFRN